MYAEQQRCAPPCGACSCRCVPPQNGTAAGHTCHAKLKGRLGNGCGHLGGDLPQLSQFWVDLGSRNLLWGDCTQARSALVRSIVALCRWYTGVSKPLHQGADCEAA